MSDCDIITLSSAEESDSSNQDAPKGAKVSRPTGIAAKSSTFPVKLERRNTDAADKDDKSLGTGACKNAKKKMIDVSKESNSERKRVINEMSNEKKNGEHQEEKEVFEKFVKTCYKYDNSKSMHTIVDTKLRRYFETSNPLYVSSKQFVDLVNKQIDNIIKNPKNLFVPIKEVVDELRSRRLKKEEPPGKRQKLISGEGSAPQETAGTASNSEGEPQPKASDRLIRKLCKTLEILHRRIKKIEEKEVDWANENDSSYMQLQRFKERFCKVHQKLQEYEGESGDGSKKFRKRITFSGTPFSTVNRTIEKFVNKKGEFPDYFDVLKLLKTTYEAENIKIKPEELRVQAKTAFQDIGGQLQKQRQYDYWDSHCMYLGEQEDPAELDESLQSKLRENHDKFGHRIAEVINKFAVQESVQNLQPIEVAEEDADKSEEDTNRKEEDDDDEEEDDENDVENEDDDKDFLDKVLKGEDDLKDNLSSDGDDDVASLDYRYCGPVSPPTLEYGDGDVALPFSVEDSRTSSISNISGETANVMVAKKTRYKLGLVQSASESSNSNEMTVVEELKETVSDEGILPRTSTPVSSPVLSGPGETFGLKNGKESLSQKGTLPVTTRETCSVLIKDKERLIHTSVISVLDSSDASDILEKSSELKDPDKLSQMENCKEDVNVTSDIGKHSLTSQLLSNNNVGSQHIEEKVSKISQKETTCNIKQETDAPKQVTNCLRVRSFGSIANMELNIRKKPLTPHKSKDVGADDSEEDDIIMLD